MFSTSEKRTEIHSSYEILVSCTRTEILLALKGFQDQRRARRTRASDLKRSALLVKLRAGNRNMNRLRLSSLSTGTHENRRPYFDMLPVCLKGFFQ